MRQATSVGMEAPAAQLSQHQHPIRRCAGCLSWALRGELAVDSMTIPGGELPMGAFTEGVHTWYTYIYIIMDPIVDIVSILEYWDIILSSLGDPGTYMCIYIYIFTYPQTTPLRALYSP